MIRTGRHCQQRGSRAIHAYLEKFDLVGKKKSLFAKLLYFFAKSQAPLSPKEVVNHNKPLSPQGVHMGRVNSGERNSEVATNRCMGTFHIEI